MDSSNSQSPDDSQSVHLKPEDHAATMARPRLAPTSSNSQYSTHEQSVTKPFRFFHPTRAEFISHADKQQGASTWNARASRKSRYAASAIHVRHHVGKETDETKRMSKTALVEQRLRHPHTQLKVHLTWDISFWVAVIFILGSTAWIVNGFILFLPLVDIGGDHTDAASWWAFVGGTLFEIGSYLMVVEALNTGHDELFGPALWGLLSRSSTHVVDEDDQLLNDKDGGSRTTKFRWIGFGSPRDLGYLACAIQMFAASIFWISTMCVFLQSQASVRSQPVFTIFITIELAFLASFPTSQLHHPQQLVTFFFWTPQVIGGTGFIVSSLLLMLEVQKKWWLPNLTSIGWHVAFWNLVGALGFTLCGALGYDSLASSGVGYQSVLSTFWGSWAFEIGSVIQFWETLWREDPDASSDSKSTAS